MADIRGSGWKAAERRIAHAAKARLTELDLSALDLRELPETLREPRQPGSQTHAGSVELAFHR
jgi:hypothetical protein